MRRRCKEIVVDADGWIAGAGANLTRGTGAVGVGKRLSVASMLFRNSGALKNLTLIGPNDPRYLHSPREFEFPEYRKWTKHCTSEENYLRSTRYCNPREPLAVAIAHELGT